MSNLEARIDAVLAAQIREGEPGAVVAAIQGGIFLHCKAYGLANLEWTIPLPTDAVFHIASLTKQFTAVAIMMLKERGLVSLDAPMNDYLPDFPLGGRHVTIRHLLNHTSGFRSYNRFSDYRELARLHLPLAAIVERLKRQPFDFLPGERYLYNNSGYVLLGAIIEKVSGAKYRDFLRQEIFAPLGMEQTSYLFDEPLVAKRAQGYQRGRAGFENASYTSPTHSHAAGGLGSTVCDLAKWDRAIRTNRLITAESFAQMLEPTRLNDGSEYPYGFGWGTADYLGRRLYHHAGGWSGFASHMLHLRDEELTTIVLSNLYLFPFDRITRAVLRAVLDEPEVDCREIAFTDDEAPAFVGRFEIDGLVREIVRFPTGLSFGEPESPNLVRISESTFCEEGDPEVKCHFRDLRDGRYQALDWITPLFPQASYRRVQG